MPLDLKVVVAEAEILEDLFNDLDSRLLLEDAAISGLRQEPQPGDDLCTVIASSVFDGLATEFCSCDVLIEGVSDVMAGDVVELKQFGKLYDGKYLVNSALHTVFAGATQPYTTRLGLVRNSAAEA